MGNSAPLELSLGIILFINLFACCHGYPSYQNNIPNGHRVPHPCGGNNEWGGVGHQLSKGGGPLNPFGIDLYKNKLENRQIWTKALCEGDSDNDGMSNGQELGDPTCTWFPGEDILLSNTTITHPGICDPIDSDVCKSMNKWFSCDQEQLICPDINDTDVQILNIRIPETQVQQNRNRYMCTHFHIPFDVDYHVIAWTPLIDNERVVHHVLLFGCHETENNPQLGDAKECESYEGPSYCYQLITWTLGLTGFCFPKQFGIALGNHGYTRFMLQVHYINSENKKGYTDSSGITLYYTPKLRQYNGAILAIGDASLSLKPGLPEVETEGICYQQCTQRMFKGSIYISAAINHMHSLGRKQRIEHYRNGILMNTITNEQDFYFKRSMLLTMKKPIEVLPGDELRTKCTYDTTSKNTTTYFGWETDQEMCFAGLIFYPEENVVSRHYCYSWFKIPHCVVNEAISTLQSNKQDYFLFTLGARSIINSLINRG